jgi:heme exporter protein CcmD
MDLGPYAVFIVTAYALTIGIIAALILLVTLERRHLARALDSFEAKGISRRSERGKELT